MPGILQPLHRPLDTLRDDQVRSRSQDPRGEPALNSRGNDSPAHNRLNELLSGLWGMCGSLAVDITERAGMIFPSLCSYAAVIENSPWGCFFFLSLSSCLSALSLPIRMSFTSSCRPSGSRGTSPVTQTVTSWNLPSRIKVSWPYLLLPSFLPPTLPDLRASLFRHGTFYCPSLSSRSTENMPVPVELGDVRLGERQPNEFIQ